MCIVGTHQPYEARVQVPLVVLYRVHRMSLDEVRYRTYLADCIDYFCPSIVVFLVVTPALNIWTISRA